jgi:adenylate cyclase
VGHDAGERILTGHIRRGDIEEIHAAIWLSDMRGFTVLADSLPPRVMIDLLNRYFDCQVPVILDHGAEVLKFMGDGLLAIFAIMDNETEACKRAFAAARQAQANIAALASSAMPGLRFGLALHIGDVPTAISAAAIGSISPALVRPSSPLSANSALPASVRRN